MTPRPKWLWRVALGCALLGSYAGSAAAQDGHDAGPSATSPANPRIAQAAQLFREGQAAYDTGDLNTALTKMSAAQRLVPSPDLAFNLGRIYERMGDAPNATRWFRAYLEHGAPTEAQRADVETRITALGALAARQRDQIIAAPPSTDELSSEARTFFLRGVAFFRRRQYGPAVEAFEAANTFVRLPEVQFNLGVCKERMNDRSEAALHFEEYLRMMPNAPDAAAVRTRIAGLRGH